MYPCSIQLRLDLGQTDGVNALLPGGEAPFSSLTKTSAADQQQQEPDVAPAAAELAAAGEPVAGAAAAVNAEPSTVDKLLAPKSPAASVAAVHATAAIRESAPLPVDPAVTDAEADAAGLLVAAAQITLSAPNDAAAVVQQNPAVAPVTSPERLVADGWARAAQAATAGSPRHPDSAPPKLGMLMGESETPRHQTAVGAELRPGSSMKRAWFQFSSKNKARRCAVHACGCA